MQLMTARETAAFLGLAENTLAKWRVQGDGPRFLRLNARCIRYDLADVQAWLQGRQRRHTADAGTVLSMRKGGET